MSTRKGVTGLFLVVVALGCLACSGDDRDTVLVMAASSLTDAFAEIEESFESMNPLIDVRLNIAGSASLREQILQGAPADVYASANESTMQAVVTAGVASSPQIFVRNRLQLAVPTSNPGEVLTLEDLAKADLLVGLCATGVPCGDFARQALDQAGVQASVDTNEFDVRALLTKLAAVELDAGIVYASDVNASDQVKGIELPASVAVQIEYPIVVLAEAPNPAGALAFTNFVLSSQGEAILASHGFLVP